MNIFTIGSLQSLFLFNYVDLGIVPKQRDQSEIVTMATNEMNWFQKTVRQWCIKKFLLMKVGDEKRRLSGTCIYGCLCTGPTVQYVWLSIASNTEKQNVQFGSGIRNNHAVMNVKLRAGRRGRIFKLKILANLKNNASTKIEMFYQGTHYSQIQ